MTRSVKGLKESLAKTAKSAKAAAGADSHDGRSTRWSAHRNARRAELVEAAVAAIDRLGPAASIEDIAGAASVSKPVLYRYFSDKSDLHAAVGAWGATTVLERLTPALVADGPLRGRVDMACEAYLALLEEHPNVFLLLVRHRVGGDTDPLEDGKAAIAAAIARVMGDVLRSLGVDPGGAEPWAHGLVGLGLSTGEWWLTRQTMSRAAVSSYLSSFVWHALEGISRSYGVALDEAGRELRLLDPSPTSEGARG
jgi:AcrR family transcriptional regulator